MRSIGKKTPTAMTEFLELPFGVAATKLNILVVFGDGLGILLYCCQTIRSPPPYLLYSFLLEEFFVFAMKLQ